MMKHSILISMLLATTFSHNATCSMRLAVPECIQHHKGATIAVAGGLIAFTIITKKYGCPFKKLLSRIKQKSHSQTQSLEDLSLKFQQLSKDFEALREGHNELSKKAFNNQSGSNTDALEKSPQSPKLNEQAIVDIVNGILIPRLEEYAKKDEVVTQEEAKNFVRGQIANDARSTELLTAFVEAILNKYFQSTEFNQFITNSVDAHIKGNYDFPGLED